MRVTSAEANKRLKKLNEQLDFLYMTENRDCKYSYIQGGDSSLIPEYNFDDVRAEIALLTNKIISLKHSINKFNNSTEVMNGLNIDEVLVILPMLNKEIYRLEMMTRETPKVQKATVGGIETTVLNYKISDVVTALDNIKKYRDDLQLSLDEVNSSIYFDIDD